MVGVNISWADDVRPKIGHKPHGRGQHRIVPALLLGSILVPRQCGPAVEIRQCGHTDHSFRRIDLAGIAGGRIVVAIIVRRADQPAAEIGKIGRAGVIEVLAVVVEHDRVVEIQFARLAIEH